MEMMLASDGGGSRKAGLKPVPQVAFFVVTGGIGDKR